MRTLLAIAGLVVAGISSGASAATVGGWEITANNDGCEIHGDYDVKGGTEVSLNLDLDGSGILLVGNKRWSILSGDTESLDFYLNGKRYRATAVGVNDRFDETKMFGSKFVGQFIDDFSSSPYLIIMKGDAVVTRVSLSGSREAIAAAKRCVVVVRRRRSSADAKVRAEAGIADDPFAKPGSAGSALAVRGGPKGNPLSWFTNDDYPADARRVGASGRVSVQLSIDTSGTVVRCRVTASSGNSSLDDATCALAQRRGRFTVQKDSAGNAQSYTYTLSGVRWATPAE